jgi:hypothetical protein
MIRALIPELCKAGRRTPFLSQDEQKLFYEKGLRPAIQHILGDISAEWPATYNDEMFRARGHNGQLSFQTKVVPQWKLHLLGDTIRYYLELNGSSWAKGLVFLHQIRGVKHSSFHSFDTDSADKALRSFLQESNLHHAVFGSGTWWVDVGIEISSPEKSCLSWRTDSHFHLVEAALEISANTACRITSVGSSKYTRDLVSHMPAVSGCRITPGPRACGPYDVQYFQAYSTDKALIYCQERGHSGKFITCTEVLKGKAKNYIQNLYNLYANAIDNNNSLARLEVRVPLCYATEVLLNLDDDLLQSSLVSFTQSIWW